MAQASNKVGHEFGWKPFVINERFEYFFSIEFFQTVADEHITGKAMIVSLSWLHIMFRSYFVNNTLNTLGEGGTSSLQQVPLT